MLATDQRQPFTDALEAAVGTCGVKPYVIRDNTTCTTLMGGEKIYLDIQCLTMGCQLRE